MGGTAQKWAEKGHKLSGKDDSQALQAYEKALEIDPSNARTWNDKGIILYRLGEHDEALKAWDKAIELDPSFSFPWNNKAQLLKERGEIEEALTAFDKAFSIDPSNFGTAYHYIFFLKDLGRDKETLIAIDKFISIYTKKFGVRLLAAFGVQPAELADFWRVKGLILMSSGKYPEALTAFDEALKVNPKNYLILWNKVSSLEALGKFREAISVYSEILKVDPEDNFARQGKREALGKLTRK